MDDITIEPCYILRPCYDEYLYKDGVKNRAERGFKKFHPSAFGGCLRKVVLQYFGEFKPELRDPSPIVPQSQRIFNAGHAHHYRMQSELTKMGILRGYWKSKLTGKVYGKENKIGIFMPESLEEVGETKPTDDKREIHELFEYEEIALSDDEYNFAGHCDGVIELERGNANTRYVIDFKTIKMERFKFLSNASRKPDHTYIAQINIYMWLLGLDKGIIFYEDKNTHELIEFLVPYDKHLIEDIKTNAKKLLLAIEGRKLPKINPHYSKDAKPCAYCGYADLCWKSKQ